MSQDPVEHFEIQRARRGSQTVSFASLGSGPPVLYLNPFGASISVTEMSGQARNLLSAIAERQRVLLLDLRATHESARGRSNPDLLTGLVADTITVFDHVDLDRVSIVANLLTVPLAIAIAARHPGRVASLVLWAGMLSGRAFAESERFKALQAERAPDREFAARSFIGIAGAVGGANEARDLTRMMPESQRPQARALIEGLLSTDVTEEAQHVQCPTLVVSPESGVLPGHSTVDGVAQSIPDSRLIRPPGASLCAHLDELSFVGPLLLEWLGRRDTDTRGEHESDLNDSVGQLTPREREVLGLVDQGLTNRAIADRLTLSPNTVIRHVSNLLPKLSASNRTEAARRARERGLLD